MPIKTKKRKTAVKKQKTSRRFRGIILFFVSFTVILFLFILYYSFSRTIILITPKTTQTEDTFNIIVAENTSEEINIEENVIEGLIIEKEVEDFLIVSDLGGPQEISGQAEGKVIIYNDWSQVQPLAATTRLLSEGGVLFRIKERIDVPAKSSVEAKVYADQEGVKGDIEPSKFTIPGLSSQMQGLVWAESKEAMSGGIRLANQITQETVLEHQNQLIDQMKQKLVLDLTSEVRAVNENYSISIDRIEYEVLEKKVEPPVGSEAELLTLSLKLKLIAVAFSEEDLQIVTKNKIEEDLDSGLSISLDNFALSYTFETFNLLEKTANFEVVVKGESLIKLSSPIFNRNNLTNKDRQQITAYFLDFDGIENVEVKFSPFWVFKSPALQDHIEIKFTASE